MVQQGTTETQQEQVVALWLYEEGSFPNNAALPALVYHRAFEPSADLVVRIEHTFEENGWSNGWRNGVYAFHHFHSTAHEVLGCYRGQASVQLGGPGGPLIALACGDVLVIPAGVAHCSEHTSADFAVVGCYANGAEYDMGAGDPAELTEAKARIANVALPVADPVHGSSGPLLSHWRS
jgi:uncharacterized protein YjlB